MTIEIEGNDEKGYWVVFEYRPNRIVCTQGGTLIGVFENIVDACKCLDAPDQQESLSLPHNQLNLNTMEDSFKSEDPADIALRQQLAAHLYESVINKESMAIADHEFAKNFLIEVLGFAKTGKFPTKE